MMFTRVAAILFTAAMTVAALIVLPVSEASATGASRRGVIAFAMNDETGRHIYTAGVTEGSARRITDGPHADLCPDFSPDGRRLAFCSDRSGSSRSGR